MRESQQRLPTAKLCRERRLDGCCLCALPICLRFLPAALYGSVQPNDGQQGAMHFCTERLH